MIENRKDPKEEQKKSKAKIDNIQRDLSLRIILQRKRLIHRLNLIKLAHQRKRNQMRQNIMNVRRSANEESTNQNKIGDEAICILNIGNETNMRNYCTANFANEAETMIECRKNESFCSLCCDHEFGEFHLDKRNSCMHKCDERNDELSYNLHDKDIVNKDYKVVDIDVNGLEKEEISDKDMRKMLDSLK